MNSKWDNKEANRFIKEFSAEGKALALRTYTARLIGSQPDLVLHGGGNTSVKTDVTDLFGQKRKAVFVKASGFNLATVTPEEHSALDLEGLLKFRALRSLDDETMVNELRRNLFSAKAATPSIEALMHAFIPETYIDHSHADVILALTNRRDGIKAVQQALGDNVALVDYVRPGFELALKAGKAYDAMPKAEGMVLMKHGLVTWGNSAKEAYENHIRLVDKAERFLARKRPKLPKISKTDLAGARANYRKVAPVLRGLLSSKDEDGRPRTFIFKPLITSSSLAFVNNKSNEKLACMPPLTSDHIIRTKPWPMWLKISGDESASEVRQKAEGVLLKFVEKYRRYFEKHSSRAGGNITPFDPLPRFILIPGIGAICVGRNEAEANIVRDITAQTIAVKTVISAGAQYEGIGERHLFDMEYFNMQRAKWGGGIEPSLNRSVAVVTGAAGAIGSGICRKLLANGCHVAATDLKGTPLDSLVAELKETFGGRVLAVPMDVTRPEDVAEAFSSITEEWGGIDLVVVNAGIAHVSALADMKPSDYQRVQKVNIEGTLYVLAEAARFFERQGAGGDVVLISTKNVFAPGAKFGAYSATKAASHQFARIASLELAPLDVRVNMVAPDAVFSHGQRKSGLWAEVGPDRMKARGLSEEGLEDYYRTRNLLKEKITAEHVARAVMFFATRQTPTTGATIPVDGGLPDATPR